MSGVAPIGPLHENSPNRRREELDSMQQAASQVPSDHTAHEQVQSAEAKQAEKTTIYGFQYTGLGSFIDKVF